MRRLGIGLVTALLCFGVVLLVEGTITTGGALIACGSTPFANCSAGSSPLTTASITVAGADANTILVASASARGQSAAISSITCNGGAITLTPDAQANANNIQAEVWHVANPSNASYTCVVTRASTAWVAVQFILLFNVDVASLVDDTATHTTTSGSACAPDSPGVLTSTVNGAAAVDAVGSNNAITSMGTESPRTESMNIDPAAAGDGAGASYLVTKATAGTMTLQWNFAAGSDISCAAAAYKPLAGSTITATTLTGAGK